MSGFLLNQSTVAIYFRIKFLFCNKNIIKRNLYIIVRLTCVHFINCVFYLVFVSVLVFYVGKNTLYIQLIAKDICILFHSCI